MADRGVDARSGRSGRRVPRRDIAFDRFGARCGAGHCANFPLFGDRSATSEGAPKYTRRTEVEEAWPRFDRRGLMDVECVAADALRALFGAGPCRFVDVSGSVVASTMEMKRLPVYGRVWGKGVTKPKATEIRALLPKTALLELLDVLISARQICFGVAVAVGGLLGRNAGGAAHGRRAWHGFVGRDRPRVSISVATRPGRSAIPCGWSATLPENTGVRRLLAPALAAGVFERRRPRRERRWRGWPANAGRPISDKCF